MNKLNKRQWINNHIITDATYIVTTFIYNKNDDDLWMECVNIQNYDSSLRL